MASNSSAMPNRAAVQVKCDIRVDVRALGEATLNEFFILRLTTQHDQCGVDAGCSLFHRFSWGGSSPDTDLYQALDLF